MDDKGGVDGLRKKLYSRSVEVGEHERAKLSPESSEVPVAWGRGEDAMPRKTPQSALRFGVPRAAGISHATKFLFGSFIFFIAAAAFSVYYFFGGGNFISSQNIDIQIVAPSLVDSGSVTEVQYIITNRNASPLLLADLVIEYPPGTRDPENPEREKLHERQSIGAISPGVQVKRTSSAIFFGQEGLPQPIEARLEYSVPNSNAVFEKRSSSMLTLGSSPVAIEVDMPTKIVAGEEFTTTITLRSNGVSRVENVVLEARYPFGYSVRSANPRPRAGALWHVGAMEQNDTYTLTLRGTIVGSDGDEKVFTFLAGQNDDDTDTRVSVPFITVPHSLTVERPFIGGTISIDGKTGSTVSASAGEPLTGTVTWRNNLSEPIQDVEIVVTLGGPMLDKNRITGGSGFYQSSDSTITWTKQQDPTLASVAPGAEGTVQFSFATLAPGSGGMVYSNPTVTVNLGVRGSRQSDVGVPEEVRAAAKTVVQLASALSLEASVNHTGGPNPPEANKQSTYTVSWAARNSSNAVANASVSTILPPYVDYVGGVGTTYDAGSRTVRWVIGELPAGAGYTGESRGVSFDIRLNASGSQVGGAPALTGSSVLQGTDRFAQVQVSASASAVTTGSPVRD